jgi:hypothetical protein
VAGVAGVAATNYPHGSDRLTNQRDGNRDATKNCLNVEAQANYRRDSIPGYDISVKPTAYIFIDLS